MSELKKIPTFSWMLRRADYLLRNDPQEYRKMNAGGSDKMLRGVTVRMYSHAEGDGQDLFQIYVGGRQYATIQPSLVDGQWYTFYGINALPTHYRQRVHKYLPVTLPEGMKSMNDTPAIFHNADGSVAATGHWIGGRRGRAGWASIPNVSSHISLVVKDSDGSFQTSAAVMAAASKWMNQSPNDLMHGFMPGVCTSKIKWYDSMRPADVEQYESVYDKDGDLVAANKIDAPLWNFEKMRTLAARVHSAAIKFVKHNPALRIALYPMQLVRDHVDHAYDHGPLWFDRFDDENSGGRRGSVVIGRNIQDTPYCYFLPTLVVYKIAAPAGYMSTYYGPDVMRSVQFLKVTIPPVGSLSLNRGPENYVVNSQTFREPGPSRGWSIHAKERACHGLLCFKVRSSDQGYIRTTSPTPHNPDADSQYHDWQGDQNAVMVKECWDGITYQPYAARPDQVFDHLLEQQLLESLPVC